MKKAFLFFGTMLLASLPAMMTADSDVSAEMAAQVTPEGWYPVSLPSIPVITSANTVTANVSEGSQDNAAAIQAAIDAVPNAGGMVVIPAGIYLSGPIKVKSKLVLHLSAGTTLRLLPYGTYPSENAYKDYRGSYKNMYFISGSSTVNDLIIEGESQETSVIDGQGAAWWQAYDEYGKFDRPSLIRVQKGERYLFRNFRMLNSPGTNLTLGQSGGANDFTVHDVTILAPKSGVGGSHNTDGIPIWGPYANIYDCYISTGDDNVVVDSNGSYIHAWNITCGAGHGMSIGSYTEKVHHIIYEDITFNNTETGFRIKTNNDRSGNDYEGTSANGSVHDIIFRNSTMTGVRDPVVMTCLYDSDPSNPSSVTPAPISAKTPEYKDILFQNITATGTPKNTSFKYGNPIYIYGRAESYIHDITFDNVKISAQKGMFMAFCKDMKFINGCYIENASGGSDFSRKYNATYTGDYKEGKTAVNMVEAAKNIGFNGGNSYNPLGQQVDEDAQGVVINGGKKFFK